MARYNTVTPALTTTTNTSLGTPAAGLFTKFTGTAPYTVTLANPVLYTGQVQTFYNATSGTVTVSTPSGVISGPGGGGAATFAVPTQTVLQIVSDGTNYILTYNTGGVLTATSGSFSSTVTLSPASANVAISPTGTGTVTISPAGALTVNPASASTINNTSIGASTRASGAFTTLAANNTTTFTLGTNASNSTTGGTLTVTGGAAVSQDFYVGGLIDNSANTSHIRVSNGTTGQRSGSPTAGMIRYNSSLTALETYTSRWQNVSYGFYHNDISSGTTAAVWNWYWCNTSGGGFTLTLPNSGLIQGDCIRVSDLTKTFDTATLTVGRNGNPIMGDAQDLTVTTEGASFELVWHGATYGWRIFSI